MQVTYPMNAAIFFWNNEGGTYPLAFLLGHENTKFNKMVQFTFESGQMNMGHGIRSCVCWFSISVNVDVYLAMRVNTREQSNDFLFA
jgi:hypothetical protein